MRRSLTYCCIAPILLLAGCGSDFATLEFDTSVRADAMQRGSSSAEQIATGYREGLIELLTEQGIDLGDIDMEVPASRGNTIVLSTPAFGGLEESQKDALHNALQAIIEARDNPFEVTFSLLPDDIDTTSSEVRQKVAELPQEYTARLEVKDVMIGVSYGIGDMLQSVLTGTGQSQSVASCNVSLAVEPRLPFYDLRLFDSDPESSGYRLTKNLRSSYSRDHIPVDIAVNHSELQALLVSGDAVMSTNLTNSSESFRNNRGIRQLELLLGSLGQIRHEQATVDFSSHVSIKSRCREMAASLGRPFSNKMGDSLDRLSSVSFH